METLTWVGIIFCISQSAMFSGLNLAFFSITKLRLEIESKTDPFLNQIQFSQKKWVILTDDNDEPKFTLNSDSFLRSALFGGPHFNPLLYCHRPIIIRDDHVSITNNF